MVPYTNPLEVESPHVVASDPSRRVVTGLRGAADWTGEGVAMTARLTIS